MIQQLLYKNSQRLLNAVSDMKDQSFQSNTPNLYNKNSKDLSSSRLITDISFQQFNTKIAQNVDEANGQFIQFASIESLPFSTQGFRYNMKMQKRSNKIQNMVKDKSLGRADLKLDRFWQSQFDQNMFKMFDNKKSYLKHLDYLKKQKKKSEEMYNQFYNQTITQSQDAFTKKANNEDFIEYFDSKIQHDIPQHQSQRAHLSDKKRLHHTFDLFVDQTDRPHDYASHQAMQFIQDQRNGSEKMIQNIQKFKSQKELKSKKNIELQTIKEQTPLVLDESLQEIRYANMKKDYQKMMHQFRQCINEYKQIQNQQNHVQIQLRKIDEEVRRRSLRSKQIKQRKKAKSSFEDRNSQTNYRQLKDLILKIKAQNRNTLYSSFNNQIEDLSLQLKKAAQPLTLKDYPIKPIQFSQRKSKSPNRELAKEPEILGYKSHDNLLETNLIEDSIDFFQFKSEMLNNKYKQSYNQIQPKVFVLSQKPELKKQYYSPFQVRILSPKANFSKKSPSLFKNIQKNQKLIPNLEQNNQNNVFQNEEIKIYAYFQRNNNVSKLITGNAQILNKCNFEIQNIFGIAFGAGGINIESQPKRLFFDILKSKRKLQFKIILNSEAINSKQFSLQITYTRSGVKRKANVKIRIPINYLISSLLIDQTAFMSQWRKIQKQIYIPMRRLQVSQMQWRQRVNLLFEIIQLKNSNSKLLYEQIASFKYAQFSPIFLMKIEYAIGNKVGIRMKIAPKADKNILEQVMDIINSMLEQ